MLIILVLVHTSNSQRAMCSFSFADQKVFGNILDCTKCSVNRADVSMAKQAEITDQNAAAVTETFRQIMFEDRRVTSAAYFQLEHKYCFM